jgi:hypothetical protein
MIKIHIGILPNQELPPNGEALRDVSHYPLMRRFIAEALSENRNLEVFVLTRVCDGWFWDLNDYYDDVRIVWDAPTERLKRKLSVHALPVDLESEPEMIIDLELLDLPDPAEGIEDVWQWIIQHKLGDVWTRETPSFEHLSQLVNWYVSNDDNIDPVLQPIVKRITQEWKSSTSGKLRNAYSRFMENPRENAYSLVTWRALALYDQEQREQWLAPTGWYSQKLEDLADMLDFPKELPQPIREKLTPVLLTYWNTELKERFND